MHTECTLVDFSRFELMLEQEEGGGRGRGREEYDDDDDGDDDEYDLRKNKARGAVPIEGEE
jgi:hypothetical protein